MYDLEILTEPLGSDDLDAASACGFAEDVAKIRRDMAKNAVQPGEVDRIVLIMTAGRCQRLADALVACAARCDYLFAELEATKKMLRGHAGAVR